MSPAHTTMGRQPVALYILGATEVGDRFAYYGLISVFVLYLTDIRHIDQSEALLIFGVFSSLTALTTLGGGIAADRIFGFGRSIIVGAVFMTAGFSVIAFIGGDAMFVSLALIAVGNGLTKPTIPALLGQFYDDEGERRASAFTHLYTAINMGAFLGMLAMGLVAVRFGYGAAFAMTACAKLLSLIVYLAGRRWLRIHDGVPARAPTGIGWNALSVVALLLITAVMTFLLANPADTGWMLFFVAGVSLGICLVALVRGDRAFSRRLLILLILVVAAIVFWALYNQFTSSVLFFTQADVDRSILDWQVPASDLSALNPAFVLVVGPLVAWLWPWLARRKMAINDYWKFALGLIFAGLAFLVLSLGVLTLPSGVKLILVWIILFQLVLAVGEVCLSPVGMALTSKLAPSSLAGSAMGIWYTSSAFAFYLSGVIAQPLAAPAGQALAVSTYGLGFAAYGAAGLGAGVVFALLIPWLRRLTPT
ncbi:MAG: peptide MFS transporter [Alphaproteobacteria bacterium]|nr:peptide MFS transporter [Alphaproteobacteria bacterium]